MSFDTLRAISTNLLPYKVQGISISKVTTLQEHAVKMALYQSIQLYIMLEIEFFNNKEAVLSVTPYHFNLFLFSSFKSHTNTSISYSKILNCSFQLHAILFTLPLLLCYVCRFTLLVIHNFL